MPEPRRARAVVTRRTIPFLLAFCVAAGCAGGSQDAAEAPPPPPTQQRQVTVDGATRHYRLFTPLSAFRDRPSPLVVVLHGVGNSPEATAGLTEFDRQAQASGFVVAYPQGVELSWNAGFCCAAAFVQDVDDVGFLNRLLDQLGAEDRIDHDRVFVVGVSAGAMMAYRFACESAERVRGVGSVAGAMLLEPCEPTRPVSVIEIHGTADPLVPYHGGQVEPPGAQASAPVPPTPAVAAHWASLDGCPDTPATHREGPVTTTTWAGCRNGASVRLVTVEGGGHTWFAPGLGPANGAVDATSAISDFFEQIGR